MRETAAVREQPPSDSRPVRSAPAHHVRSLDGIRFFAFLGVFIFHALQNNPAIRHWVEYGALGVQVFFVLSGFLIGGILLELKSHSEVPLGQRLRTFYIRRALRIFPVYYMTLVLLLALPAFGITAVGGSEFFFWNAAYLTNVKIYLIGGMGGLSHFWSLAVEEHFYLIAPLVLLTVSTRRLSLGFVFFWIACAVATFIFALRNDRDAYVLSPLQFDCMTVGIAAAILQKEGTFLGITHRSALRLAAVCAVLVTPVFALRLTAYRPAYLLGQAFEHWVFSVAVAGLLLVLWNAPHSRLSRWLAIEPLPYLGKISYGLYVFHLPCLVLAYVWLSPYMEHGTAIPALLLTTALAALSWRFVERPINDQKRRFPYV